MPQPRFDALPEHILIAHRRSDAFAMPVAHYHDGFELHLVLNGRARFLLADQVVRTDPGTLLIIPPGVAHQLIVATDKTFERVFVNFHQSVLQPYVIQHPEAFAPFVMPETAPIALHFSGSALTALVGQLAALEQACVAPTWPKLRAELALISVCMTLTDAYQHDATLAHSAFSEYAADFDQMAGYLRKHYAEALRLDDLAAHFFISAATINRIFKHTVGMTPMQYLAYLRINQALLGLAAGQPIPAVAKAVGYADATSFSRRFKQIKGCPPKHFIAARKP